MVFLATRPCDSILEVSLSVPSVPGSLKSLDDIPSFVCHDATPPLFLNVTSTQASSEDAIVGRTITVPTSPRLKSMLLEPIVVQGWAVRNSFLSHLQSNHERICRKRCHSILIMRRAYCFRHSRNPITPPRGSQKVA